MIHINFGPSRDYNHLRERRCLELMHKKHGKTQSVFQHVYEMQHCYQLAEIKKSVLFSIYFYEE